MTGTRSDAFLVWATGDFLAKTPQNLTADDIETANGIEMEMLLLLREVQMEGRCM